ncbi:5-oxoprolinase subunit PxpB [Priestia koreensis]|uniref:5-oxoprolinase subunit PxpB n=1 Tax=Priestia koreensis TaxID=284581 RepID=UPI001F592CAD|nr:5-oxoprolinase subunit PxpB [Priestia koreensis]UNL85757.1 5-oxoprolinase subunit PxpB [Priestia koreensis]
MKKSAFHLYPLGDAAIVVQFGDRIDRDIHRKIKTFVHYLEATPIKALVEYVPAFTTVTIYYDPLQLQFSPYDQIKNEVTRILLALDVEEEAPSRTVQIPVCYEGEFAPDLAEVARHNGLSQEEVIDLHTSGEYLVYMLGFAPGFPYLGGLSEKLATPRKASPRSAIPAGSVGIAGNQTGVYPFESPGGWQIIGRTPLALFQPHEDPPTLLQAGDIIQFTAISKKEYDEWSVSI